MHRRIARCRGWCELPPEILDLLLQRLPHPDCLTFAKVCTSWRSVFLERRRISLPPPCLVMTPVTGRIPRHLWVLHRGQVRRLKSPKPHLLSQHWIAGSSMGWLVIASQSGIYYTMHMLNPISNQQIPLPSIFSGDHYLYAPSRVIQNVVLSSSPTTTNDSLILAILWCRSTQVHYLLGCRVGDLKWTYFKNETLDVLNATRDVLKESCDSVFHKNELYVLCRNGDVLVCVLSHDAKYYVRVCIPSMWIGNYLFQRLVLSDGELLLVVRQSFSTMNGSSEVLSVFRSTEERGGEWVRMESLGDRVLLIGLHGAESLSKEELMGCTYEPNCIYYQPYYQFLEKFCMSDGSNQSFTIPSSLKGRSPGLEWVVAKTW